MPTVYFALRYCYARVVTPLEGRNVCPSLGIVVCGLCPSWYSNVVEPNLFLCSRTNMHMKYIYVYMYTGPASRSVGTLA
jgi:hypothetical protein